MKVILRVRLRGFPECCSLLDEQALRVLLQRVDVREGLAETVRVGLAELLPDELAGDLEVQVLGTNLDTRR
jgi:hypothetical protein